MRVQFTKEDWENLQIPGIKVQPFSDGKWYVHFYNNDFGQPVYHPVDFVERYVNLTANKENKETLDKFFGFR